MGDKSPKNKEKKKKKQTDKRDKKKENVTAISSVLTPAKSSNVKKEKGS